MMKYIELFRGLSDSQLKRLAEISQKETYSEEQEIVRQGSPGDKMYLVGQGQVEVQFRDGTGASHPAVYLGEGQVFGEMALLDQGPRSATVVAVEDGTVLYSIPGDKFTKLCSTDTNIGYLMMRNVALDLSFKLRHRDTDPTS